MFILYSPFKVSVIKERSMPIRAHALYLYNRRGIIAYNLKTSYRCKKIFSAGPEAAGKRDHLGKICKK